MSHRPKFKTENSKPFRKIGEIFVNSSSEKIFQATKSIVEKMDKLKAIKIFLQNIVSSKENETTSHGQGQKICSAHS